MRDRHTSGAHGASRAGTGIGQRRLRALAGEAALHAEVGLAMAGLDDEAGPGFEPEVCPHPAGPGSGLRILMRDADGEELDVVVDVSPAGTAHARIPGEDAPQAPPRRAGDLAALAWDVAELAREPAPPRPC